MLVPGVQFSDFILAIHILGAIVGFGVTFTYPLLFAAAARADPQVTPWLWATTRKIERYVVNPGLLVVVLAGIYLATDEHRWSQFFVAWGIGAALVIGGVVGGYMIPREGKLAELAAKEVAAAGVGATGGQVTWSEEYNNLARQVKIGGGLLYLLVVITVFLMATHAGA